MPVIFMGPLASALSLISFSGSQSPYYQGDLILSSGKHGPAQLRGLNCVQSRASTPWEEAPSSRTAGDPCSDWHAH